MQPLRQLVDRPRLVHHFEHQSTARLRQNGKHPLRILERERNLSIECAAPIGAARRIPCPREETLHGIRANHDLGHGFLPRVQLKSNLWRICYGKSFTTTTFNPGTSLKSLAFAVS